MTVASHEVNKRKVGDLAAHVREIKKQAAAELHQTLMDDIIDTTEFMDSASLKSFQSGMAEDFSQLGEAIISIIKDELAQLKARSDERYHLHVLDFEVRVSSNISAYIADETRKVLEIMAAKIQGPET